MTLEVFYDYACPYCDIGYRMLNEVLAEHPEIEVVWRPCEAHPRPEIYGRHSDLCARGFYQAAAQGVAPDVYHERMFRIALHDRKDIESLTVLADAVVDILDRKEFADRLLDGAFLTELDENNREAWLEENFPAVPSLRMNGKTLASIPEIGLTKERITRFLQT